MSIRSNTPASHYLFRSTVLLFAFVLGCQATWILTAEYSRSSSRDFAGDAQAATAANRKAAALAASFGIIRGDLWGEYALTYLNLVQRVGPDSGNVQVSKTAEQAREVADRALALAPHDARIWLVLAGIDAQFGSLKHKPAAALQMSYYTGANETELIPLRLRLAVNSNALADKDFQQLVRHDIHTIVTRKPELTPAILAAYRDALPFGQQFLEETLKEIDPALLARLAPKG